MLTTIAKKLTVDISYFSCLIYEIIIIYYVNRVKIINTAYRLDIILKYSAYIFSLN